MLCWLLVCMVLAAVIQHILRMVAVRICEKRFLKDANSIFMLYSAVYPVIEYGFNDDSIIVGAQFEYEGCKIEFRNPVEGCTKFINLVQKSMKNYYRTLDLVYLDDEQIAELEIDKCKKELERMCETLTNLKDCAEKS